MYYLDDDATFINRHVLAAVVLCVLVGVALALIPIYTEFFTYIQKSLPLVQHSPR
jgi:hypothetical protein